MTTVEGSETNRRSYRVAGAHPPQYVDGPGPGTETYMYRRCPPGGRGVGMWVMSPEGVDMQVLIDAASASARGRIPMPAIDINPPPEVGGFVNLGLWLAVHDPGQVNAIAEIGPVWAAVTARFTGMTWDMGNGDVVECSGTGTPYPEGESTIEQGPCGYTYTEQPPLDGYTITATGHWHVELTTSDGRAEALDPMSAAYRFDYDVDEVITAGRG